MLKPSKKDLIFAQRFKSGKQKVTKVVTDFNTKEALGSFRRKALNFVTVIFGGIGLLSFLVAGFFTVQAKTFLGDEPLVTLQTDSSLLQAFDFLGVNDLDLFIFLYSYRWIIASLTFLASLVIMIVLQLLNRIFDKRL